MRGGERIIIGPVRVKRGMSPGGPTTVTVVSPI
jgi:hypothetical protein